MSCPMWDLPESDREHWDLVDLCSFMGCRECEAEPGEMPWIPDAGIPPMGEEDAES